MRFPLIALALTIAAAHAAAEPLHYDLNTELRQREMVSLYVRTRQCLGTAARAIMNQGVLEEATVEHFMVTMCGDPFYGALRRDGMPEEQARRTLVALTKQALYEDVLHQPIPSN